MAKKEMSKPKLGSTEFPERPYHSLVDFRESDAEVADQLAKLNRPAKPNTHGGSKRLVKIQSGNRRTRNKGRS